MKDAIINLVKLPVSIVSWIARMLEDDKGVPDEARVGALILVGCFAWNSVASVMMGSSHAFNAQDFGIGAGALAAGLGAWLGLRKDN
jgi:hypothetical protein